MTSPTIGSLFTGYGGLEMGLQSAIGGTVAWHSEIEPAACKLLDIRFPGVPNIGDITATDWSAVEPVDVLVGGFPCQDLSTAGRGAGLRDGTRSGLWAHFVQAIDALRPQLVVIENVRGLLSGRTAESADVLGPSGRVVGRTNRAMGRVLADLAGMGFDAGWGCVRASDAGAPHRRERIFIVAQPAHAGSVGPQRRTDGPGACGRGDDEALLPTPLSSEGDKQSANPETSARRLAKGQQLGLMGVANLELVSDFGKYAPAIERWERLTGRKAPAAVEPNPRTGRHRLSPAFSEWMMGLPAGHVTGIPGLSYAAQLKLIGNGVVPQQAALAVSLLT